MTDLLGRTVKVGDLFAYPVRQGSTTYTVVIRVSSVGEHGVIGTPVRDSRDRNYLTGEYMTPPYSTAPRRTSKVSRGVVVDTPFEAKAAA